MAVYLFKRIIESDLLDYTEGCEIVRLIDADIIQDFLVEQNDVDEWVINQYSAYWVSNFIEKQPTINSWIDADKQLPIVKSDDDIPIMCNVIIQVGDKYEVDLAEWTKHKNIFTKQTYYDWVLTNDWDEGQGCVVRYWQPLAELPEEFKNRERC